MPVRTVIDSCVLRTAFEGEEGEINKRALAVLDDTDREFIAVDFVALETIPKPTFNKRQEQALIFRTFFEEAPLHAEVSTEVTNLAIKLDVIMTLIRWMLLLSAQPLLVVPMN